MFQILGKYQLLAIHGKITFLQASPVVVAGHPHLWSERGALFVFFFLLPLDVGLDQILDVPRSVLLPLDPFKQFRFGLAVERNRHDEPVLLVVPVVRRKIRHVSPPFEQILYHD